MEGYLFTSECVTPGHPDKICDQISDAIVSYCLANDKKSRVAVETMISDGMVCVSGEVTTAANMSDEVLKGIVDRTISRIGYNETYGKKFGFDVNNYKFITNIHKQSPDIAMGVDVGGAGDQGMMFGGAVNETPELMPLPMSMARKLTDMLFHLSKRTFDGKAMFGPDGKSQVTVKYGADGKPCGIDTVVISIQHIDDVSIEDIRELVKTLVIKPVLNSYGYDIINVKHIYINPTGKFVIGGPEGDSGLTGRKIIVDTYGGYFRHGGGAFSGKDLTKVDRSAAYMSRYIAKNLVMSKVCDKCEVQLSYAIGVEQPVSVNVNTYGTGRLSDKAIAEIVYKVFDMSPKGMISKFGVDFDAIITAEKGHFGNREYAWEMTDKVLDIKNILTMKE